MLIDAKMHEEFVKEFIKKFDSFCIRAPLLIAYTLGTSWCDVEDLHTKEIKRFEFDYTKSVFDNISVIKDWLVNEKYPLLIKVDTKTDNLIKYRIEKVVTKKDCLVIRDLEADKLLVYKIKIPSTIFLKRLREGKWDQFKAYLEFEKRADYLYEMR